MLTRSFVFAIDKSEKFLLRKSVIALLLEFPKKKYQNIKHTLITPRKSTGICTFFFKQMKAITSAKQNHECKIRA